MTMDSSLKPTQSSSAGRYREIWNELDAIDKEISGVLFRLSLPPIVEAIYSVPANFFGLVPSVATGPLWIALLTLEESIGTNEELRRGHFNHKIRLLRIITGLSTIVFLVAWAQFQLGHVPLAKLLAQRYGYLLSIICNVGFLSYALLDLPSNDPYAAPSKKAFSLAIYILFLWPPSMLVIMILKEFFQRVRPVALDNGDCDRWVAKKAFPNICHFCANYSAKESFPSGDATSAAIFAIVLVNITPRYTIPAVCLWVLACTGRVYVLAHHFLDVLAGSVIALAIHKVVSSVGLGIEDMRWWHPLASTAFLGTYVKTMMKSKIA
jgi:membrane-associated phospholipid phosphatase